MSKIVTLNKTKQFYMILKEQILNGEYKADQKLPSIRDLSEEYGISKTTVNTVIAILSNEGFVKVKEGLGTFVSLGKPKIKSIGVMLFDFTQSMRVDTDILGIIQHNTGKDYYLNLMDTSNNFSLFIDGLHRLIDNGVAGLIITPPKDKFTSGQFEEMKDLLKDIPVVFIIRNIDGIKGDFYSIDLSKGISKAFEYLDALNHTEVALIKHDSPKFIKEEMRGLDNVEKTLGIKLKASNIIDWEDDIDAIRNKVADILPDINGLIAPDSILYELQDVIHGIGKRIPEELSIIGINNTVYSKMFYPQLTAIDFSAQRIGLNAIRTLIDRIEGKTDKPELHKNYDPDLIIRGT